MNKLKLKDIERALKSVSLTDDEKARLKENIFNTEPTKLRNSFIDRLIYATQNTRSILTNIKNYKPMPIALVLAMFLSGGAAFAAEGSLPGDLLYPVKVEVNERVGEVLAFSTEAKAEFETKLAEKRINEIERLAKKGQISAEVSEELKAKFAARAEKARTLLAELEASGQLGVSAESNLKFQNKLKARLEALASLAAEVEDESDKEELRKWSVKVRSENEKHGLLQLKLEAGLKSGDQKGFENRAEGRLNAAENKVNEVTAFIESRADRTDEEIYTEAQVRLEAAVNLLDEGRVSLEAGTYGEALISLNKAFYTAMEAKALVKEGKQTTQEAKEEVESDDEEVDEEDEEEAKAKAKVKVKVSI